MTKNKLALAQKMLEELQLRTSTHEQQLLAKCARLLNSKKDRIRELSVPHIHGHEIPDRALRAQDSPKTEASRRSSGASQSPCHEEAEISGNTSDENSAKDKAGSEVSDDEDEIEEEL